jgi:hypothetical protein
VPYTRAGINRHTRMGCGCIAGAGLTEALAAIPCRFQRMSGWRGVLVTGIVMSQGSPGGLTRFMLQNALPKAGRRRPCW